MNEKLKNSLHKWPFYVFIAFVCAFLISIFVIAQNYGNERKAQETQTTADNNLNDNVAHANKISRSIAYKQDIDSSLKKKLEVKEPVKQDSLALKGEAIKDPKVKTQSIDSEDFYKDYIAYKEQREKLKDKNKDTESQDDKERTQSAALDIDYLKNPPKPTRQDRTRQIFGGEDSSFYSAMKAPSAVKLNLGGGSISEPKFYERDSGNYSQTSEFGTLNKPHAKSGGFNSNSADSFDRQNNTLARYDSLKQGSHILDSSVESPQTPYALMQGSVIRAVLVTGINSELPGQITAQVTHDVRDSLNFEHLLIPRGSKLIGQYGSNAQVGATRLFIGFNRIIFPNGQSLSIGAMPGTASDGYAGFSGDVDNHYLKTILSCMMLSAITTTQDSIEDHYQEGFGRKRTITRSGRELSSNIGDALANIIERNLNLAPTLSVKPGYRFSISTTQDIFFKSPYGVVEGKYYIN